MMLFTEIEIEETAQMQNRSCKYCARLHKKGKCPTYGKMCNRCDDNILMSDVCASVRKKTNMIDPIQENVTNVVTLIKKLNQ